MATADITVPQYITTPVAKLNLTFAMETTHRDTGKTQRLVFATAEERIAGRRVSHARLLRKDLDKPVWHAAWSRGSAGTGHRAWFRHHACRY